MLVSKNNGQIAIPVEVPPVGEMGLRVSEVELLSFVPRGELIVARPTIMRLNGTTIKWDSTVLPELPKRLSTFRVPTMGAYFSEGSERRTIDCPIDAFNKDVASAISDRLGAVETWTYSRYVGKAEALHVFEVPDHTIFDDGLGFKGYCLMESDEGFRAVDPDTLKVDHLEKTVGEVPGLSKEIQARLPHGRYLGTLPNTLLLLLSVKDWVLDHNYSSIRMEAVFTLGNGDCDQYVTTLGLVKDHNVQYYRIVHCVPGLDPDVLAELPVSKGMDKALLISTIVKQYRAIMQDWNRVINDDTLLASDLTVWSMSELTY